MKLCVITVCTRSLVESLRTQVLQASNLIQFAWRAAGPGNDAEVVSQNHQEMLDEVKAQLRDMAKMELADYKQALRRLFLRWHPDKSGNTPFNNLIFRMLLGLQSSGFGKVL